MLLRYCLASFILLVFLLSVIGCGHDSQSGVVFGDSFEQGIVDVSRWEITSDGDFTEAVVDVLDVEPGGASDYRLRLRANTIGTSDPLKYLGVRTLETIDFSDTTHIELNLDWNKQSNGCYLTASLYLCPIISDNPKDEDDWLQFEYSGVPPGQNVRVRLQKRVDSLNQIIYSDAGPYDSDGKPLGNPLGNESHHITLVLNMDSLQVFQDGIEIYPLTEHNLAFTSAYIYLQMSSGTNYPSREVYFDDILVTSVTQ
jgi:hypothetical protein